MKVKMEQKNKTQNKIVETYAEDVAKIIEEDRSGLIKKIIHEEAQHEIVKKNLSPQSKKNRFFMFVGLLFIVFGFLTLYYLISNRQAPTIPIEEQFIPIIFNDKSVFLEVKDMQKEEIAQSVLNKVTATEVKEGGVEGIYLIRNKKIIGLREFLSSIKSNFVISDNAFLVRDDFLMGVINSGTQPASSAGKDFFILIKVRSTGDIFESLRAWENKMFFDIYGFFGMSLSPETRPLLTADFEDGIIQNRNARILYDGNKKIVMMYVLADENSVIIANTESAVREIMLRLASSRVQK